MAYCSWPRLAQIYRGAAAGEIGLIGWGAGAQMRRQFELAPAPLRYVIDSNRARAGERFLGFEVRPPEALLDEDPAKVAVLVWPTRSHRTQIAAQIAALGPFDAITPFSTDIAQRFCLAMDRVEARALTAKPPASSRNGIVVQGAYDPGATPSVLRILAAHYPDDWVVWSTWADTPPAVVEAMRGWCDDIVLSQPPARPGNGNANLQRASTLAGLARLRERGVRLALKTRSDAAPLARNLFASAEALLDALPPPAPGGALKRRIIVSSVYTLLHVPLHVSDIAQVGDLEDLQALWSFPEDAGPPVDLYALSTQLMPLEAYVRARLTGETHLGHRLAALRGLEVDYSLAQYLRIVRDDLVVVDHPWLDIFVPKYSATTDSLFLPSAERPRSLIDFEAWIGLQGGRPDVLRDLIGDFDAPRACLLDLQFGAREAAEMAARARLATPSMLP